MKYHQLVNYWKVSAAGFQVYQWNVLFKYSNSAINLNEIVNPPASRSKTITVPSNISIKAKLVSSIEFSMSAMDRCSGCCCYPSDPIPTKAQTMRAISNAVHQPFRSIPVWTPGTAFRFFSFRQRYFCSCSAWISSRKPPQKTTTMTTGANKRNQRTWRWNFCRSLGNIRWPFVASVWGSTRGHTTTGLQLNGEKAFVLAWCWTPSKHQVQGQSECSCATTNKTKSLLFF